MTLPAGLPSTSAPTSYLGCCASTSPNCRVSGSKRKIAIVSRPPVFDATISVLLSERKPSGTNAVPEVRSLRPISFHGESALLR